MLSDIRECDRQILELQTREADTTRETVVTEQALRNATQATARFSVGMVDRVSRSSVRKGIACSARFRNVLVRRNAHHRLYNVGVWYATLLHRDS